MSKQRIYRVLLVEDNPADAKLVELHLDDSNSKFHLFKAETLIQGLKLARSKDIDITLLDLTLPDSSGFKTLSNYLEKCSDIPVIVFTGLNNEIVGNQAVRAGAQDYLVKGQFDYSLLNRAIRYAIQRFESKQQLAETARQLQISEIRYEQTQELANFGQWEIDLVSNRMKWSPSVYKIFGFKPGSVNPSLKFYLDYAHYDDKNEVEEFFDACIRDGKSRKLEHRILLNGNSIRHVILQARVFHDQETGETLLIGALQDITEHKHSEDALLEKALEDRIHQDKEQALKAFDFQFRTPLSSINHYLHLLGNEKLNQTQREHLELLDTAVGDLTLTVNNLLNFSVLFNSGRESRKETIAVPEFLERLTKILPIRSQEVKYSCEIEWNGPSDTELLTDPEQLSHILFNILHFTLEMTSCQADTILKADITSDKKLLVINLTSEWGPGTKLHYKHLFNWLEKEGWKRINSEEDNAQRRIQVAALLAERLGGQLSVDFDPQKNLMFHLTIGVEPALKHHAEQDAIKQNMNILLVEDNFLNLSSTRHILESKSPNMRVDVAENGLIAVEKHRAHSYDLILMDLQMPVMDGFEATEHIRQKDESVPIIGLSASSSQEEKVKCKMVGMNDFLLKPFTPEALLTCISTQLTGQGSDVEV